MARTYRRRHCRYDYRWVLRTWEPQRGWPKVAVRLDPRSTAGRKALARYHSDATVTMRQGAPRWYRKVHDTSIKMHNREMLQRWLRDPEFDPVFISWHRHNANWSWW